MRLAGNVVGGRTCRALQAIQKHLAGGRGRGGTRGHPGKTDHRPKGNREPSHSTACAAAARCTPAAGNNLLKHVPWPVFKGPQRERWRRQWHPTPVLLPGKSHGRRSLLGCSPWGREELDTTERLPFHFSLSCIGEGNGNPLQCSCVETPRDGGAR